MWIGLCQLFLFLFNILFFNIHKTLLSCIPRFCQYQERIYYYNFYTNLDSKGSLDKKFYWKLSLRYNISPYKMKKINLVYLLIHNLILYLIHAHAHAYAHAHTHSHAHAHAHAHTHIMVTCKLYFLPKPWLPRRICTCVKYLAAIQWENCWNPPEGGLLVAVIFHQIPFHWEHCL